MAMEEYQAAACRAHLPEGAGSVSRDTEGKTLSQGSSASASRVPSLTPPTAGMVHHACTRGRGVGLMVSNAHLQMRFPSSGRA